MTIKNRQIRTREPLSQKSRNPLPKKASLQSRRKQKRVPGRVVKGKRRPPIKPLPRKRQRLILPRKRLRRLHPSKGSRVKATRQKDASSLPPKRQKAPPLRKNRPTSRPLKESRSKGTRQKDGPLTQQETQTLKKSMSRVLNTANKESTTRR